MGSKKKTMSRMLALALLASLAHGATLTGTVAMLEVWRSGNVAFTVSGVSAPCNGQFILNASDPGFKNLYAAVLAAKKTNAQLMVATGGCGPADNYGSDYNIVTYLYVLE